MGSTISEHEFKVAVELRPPKSFGRTPNKLKNELIAFVKKAAKDAGMNKVQEAYASVSPRGTRTMLYIRLYATGTDEQAKGVRGVIDEHIVERSINSYDKIVATTPELAEPRR